MSWAWQFMLKHTLKNEANQWREMASEHGGPNARTLKIRHQFKQHMIREKKAKLYYLMNLVDMFIYTCRVPSSIKYFMYTIRVPSSF